MPPDWGQPIPAAPFVAWITRELECLSADDTLRLDEQMNEVPAMQILAERLRINERTLRRYKNSLDSEGRETDVFARNRVEDMLDRVDVPFADVYPEIAAGEDVDLEPEAFCNSCHEIVTPIDGACPWCDREVKQAIPERMYCKREDAMRFPANDGNCWRCGGPLRRHVPQKPCECGCGTMIPRFNQRSGIPRRVALGHGSPWHSTRELPAEPLALWLEDELRNLDPIQSLARKTGLARDRVLALLNRQVETTTTEEVNRALRLAGQEGQGRGHGMRPGSVKIDDIYPDRGGVLKCPGCRGRKSAHAQLCRTCRLKAGWVQPGTLKRDKSLTPELLVVAREMRQGGHTWHEIAVQLQPRTRCRSVDSVRTGLISEFSKQGEIPPRAKAA